MIAIFSFRRDRSSYSSGHASDSSIGDSLGPRGRSRSLKRLKSCKCKGPKIMKSISILTWTSINWQVLLLKWSFCSKIGFVTVYTQSFLLHTNCLHFNRIEIKEKRKLIFSFSFFLIPSVSSRSDAASSSGYESMRNDASHASSDSCSEKGLSRGKRKGEKSRYSVKGC